MLRVDVEAAILKLFGDGLGAAYELDEAGDSFRAVGLDVWVEPRILEFGPRTQRSQPGEEDDIMRLRVRCFVRQGRKDGEKLSLSRVVDDVRALCDGTLGAQATKVTTKKNEGDPFVVGTITWQGAREQRQFAATITVGGDAVPDVDIATLLVDAQVRGGSCG